MFAIDPLVDRMWLAGRVFETPARSNICDFLYLQSKIRISGKIVFGIPCLERGKRVEQGNPFSNLCKPYR